MTALLSLVRGVCVYVINVESVATSATSANRRLRYYQRTRQSNICRSKTYKNEFRIRNRKRRVTVASRRLEIARCRRRTFIFVPGVTYFEDVLIDGRVSTTTHLSAYTYANNLVSALFGSVYVLFAVDFASAIVYNRSLGHIFLYVFRKK